MSKYDLAISFAGEQRELARRLAVRLDAAGYAIFFDEFRQGELWGQDLTVALGDVYSREARWCLVLVSRDYVRKPWTNLERQNALFRFMQERSGYLLALKLDDAQLPGLPSVIGYLSFHEGEEESVFGVLLQKLGKPQHDDYIAKIDPKDRELASKVIQSCYRRAIFTRMDSEINLRAMYDSISEAAGQIQPLIPQMKDQSLQFAVLRILRALDAIERVQNQSGAGYSNHLESERRLGIDSQKRDIIRLSLEIRRAAAISIQLPSDLQVDHFFSPDEARQPPGRDK